jgi:hypothetical protein
VRALDRPRAAPPADARALDSQGAPPPPALVPGTAGSGPLLVLLQTPADERLGAGDALRAYVRAHAPAWAAFARALGVLVEPAHVVLVRGTYAHPLPPPGFAPVPLPPPMHVDDDPDRKLPPDEVAKAVVTSGPVAMASARRRMHAARFVCDICGTALTTKRNLEGGAHPSYQKSHHP